MPLSVYFLFNTLPIPYLKDVWLMVILELSNYDLLQFVQWAIPGEANPDTFFTDDRVKTLYKNHIRDFLNHVNTKTGLAYKDDPVIFGFGEDPNTLSDLDLHHPQACICMHPSGKLTQRLGNQTWAYDCKPHQPCCPHPLVYIIYNRADRRQSVAFAYEVPTEINSADWVIMQWSCHVWMCHDMITWWHYLLCAVDLINEVRSACNTSAPNISCTPAATAYVQSWTEEMAGYFKTVDKNHMLTTGEEGFYPQGARANQFNPGQLFATGSAQDFVANHRIANIDYAVTHTWVGERSSVDWQQRCCSGA